MGVRKMGNMTLRVEIEPASLAFLASVLTITLPGLCHVTMLCTPTCLFGSLPEVSADYYTYIRIYI